MLVITIADDENDNNKSICLLCEKNRAEDPCTLILETFFSYLQTLFRTHTFENLKFKNLTISQSIINCT